MSRQALLGERWQYRDHFVVEIVKPESGPWAGQYVGKIVQNLEPHRWEIGRLVADPDLYIYAFIKLDGQDKPDR